MFLINSFLMFVWVALTGNYGVNNLLAGFAVGYAILWAVKRPDPYFKRAPAAVGLLLYFLWQLVKSNIRVAMEVLTPRHHMRPGIVAVPLDVKSDLGIVLLSSMVTLTPGTLCLEVSRDRKLMYVHEMYITTPEEVVSKLKGGFERLIIKVFEP